MAFLVLFSYVRFKTEHFQAHAATLAPDEPPVSVVEMQYEKLMKIYVNKLKQAFSESDDAQVLAILHQFQPEFNLRTEEVKQELQEQVKQMNPAQKEKLYARLAQRSHVDELMALLFHERVTSRLAANAEIKLVMDQLYAKSLEVHKPGREFIAAGQ